MMTRAVMIPMALLAIGCAPAQGDAGIDPIARASCDATRVQRHVGRAPVAATLAAIRTGSRSRTVRLIRPGQAVTMDYRTDRVNVSVGAANRITEIRCG